MTCSAWSGVTFFVILLVSGAPVHATTTFSEVDAYFPVTCVAAPELPSSLPLLISSDAVEIHDPVCPPDHVPQPLALKEKKGMPNVELARDLEAPLNPETYFFYDSAIEYVATTSISARLTQHNPSVDRGNDHSLVEVAAQSADRKNIVEIGWIVFDYDPEPQLFVFHWVNGIPTCYNACGYVQLSATRFPGMKVTVTSDPQQYAIQYRDGNWYVGYQGEWIGYFPGTIWSGAYTEIGLAQWFGEVAASSPTPCTQMGSGILGTLPGAASVSFERVGDNDASAILGEVSNAAWYVAGNFEKTGYSLGGPGACKNDKPGFERPAAERERARLAVLLARCRPVDGQVPPNCSGRHP